MEAIDPTLVAEVLVEAIVLTPVGETITAPNPVVPTPAIHRRDPTPVTATIVLSQAAPHRAVRSRVVPIPEAGRRRVQVRAVRRNGAVRHRTARLTTSVPITVPISITITGAAF